jgi:hypothetical protein
LNVADERDESDQVSVRNGEPLSTVVNAEERLGTLKMEDVAVMGGGETRRLGRGRDLIDPFNCGVFRVMLNSSSSSFP